MPPQFLSGAEAVASAADRLFPSYVGKEWLVSGLTSEKGLQLNGKLGVCEGFDPMPAGRLHMRIGGTVVKLKIGNILNPDTAPAEPTSVTGVDLGSGSEIERETILRISRTRYDGQTVRQHIESAATAERPDMRYRAKRLVALLDKFEENHSTPHVTLGCGDPGEEALADTDPFVRHLQSMKPGCVGNDKFHLHELFAGGVDDVQAGRRLAEYPMSGFCVGCQRVYMEGQQG